MSSRAMLIKAGGVYPLSFAGVRRLCCRETHIAHGRLCRGFLQYSNGTFNNFPFFQTNASSEKDGVAPVEQEVDESEKEFAALGVDPRLMEGLLGQRLLQPTPVQREVIPEILKGDNVAVQCYTGSGKTLAYLLPALTMAIERSEREWQGVTRKTAGNAGTVQAVVVAPSRELAMQIVRVAESVLPPKAKKAVQQCIGGANIHRQREALKMYKPVIVVGTPGRLSELSRDGSLQTHRCGLLILDEIDQLLAPQFREDMVRITEHTGKKYDGGRQTVTVSATLTPRVLTMCKYWCPDPVKIFIDGDGNRIDPPKDEPVRFETRVQRDDISTRGWNNPDELFPVGIPVTTSSAGGYDGRTSTPSIAPGLNHVFVSSPPQHKVDALRRAIHALGSKRVLVFMNFQHRLKEAEAKLKARSITAASLHGELSKVERRKALDAFRSGKLRVLIVSDVAARGLDVPECDAVVNLELPSDPSHYAHRAGRTGRGGRTGSVVSIVTGKERFVMEKFKNALNIVIEEVEFKFGLSLPKGRGDSSSQDATL